MYPCLILADHRNSMQVFASWIPRFERLAGPCVSITTTRSSYVAASQITAAPARNDGKVMMTAPNLIVDYMGAASQTGLVGPVRHFRHTWCIGGIHMQGHQKIRYTQEFGEV